MTIESCSDVIVIGGGLHGLSAGLYLARAGQRVAILEESWVGRHSSGGSAAGVRTLLRSIKELPISFEANDMWHNISSIVGDSCGFHADGQIRVAETAEDVLAMERRLEQVQKAGFDHEEIIDGAELRRMVPAISKHCVAALCVRNDGAADPHRALRAFRQSFESEGGKIHEGFGVVSIDQKCSDWMVRAGDRNFIAPVIVNAAGAWGAKIASMIGDNVNLGHKASMVMVTERVSPFIKPVVSAFGRSLSFKQTDKGTVLIGGGLQGRADLHTQKSFVDFAELSKGALAVKELFPAAASLRIVRAWAGIEAKTKDLLPIIGPAANAPGFFHVFGFSGHGFQPVPVVGDVLKDLIVHGSTSRNIDAFSVNRLLK